MTFIRDYWLETDCVGATPVPPDVSAVLTTGAAVGRYFCSHSAGVHAVALPLVAALQKFAALSGRWHHR